MDGVMDKGKKERNMTGIILNIVTRIHDGQEALCDWHHVWYREGYSLVLLTIALQQLRELTGRFQAGQPFWLGVYLFLWHPELAM